MKMAFCRAGMLALLTACWGLAQAAVIDVRPTLSLTSPVSLHLDPEALDVADGAKTYFELDVSAFGAGPRHHSATQGGGGSGAGADFVLYQDVDPVLGRGNTGAVLGSWSGNLRERLNLVPFFANLMEPGQYILAIDPTGASAERASPVSAVPLPGAGWLLASALALFGVLGTRRGL